MIAQKTVFVLGAGAHKPYGLPLGGELLASILQLLRTSETPESAFYMHAYMCHPSTAIRDAFKTIVPALNMSGHTSIDSFIATNAGRPGFQEIIKQAVAWHLMPLEFKHTWERRPHKGDWMTYLFETMLHGCLDSVDSLLKCNNVEFVTFNYDRTLEDFLTTRVAGTYNLSSADAWKQAQKFNLVHVYGSLGKFDPAVIDSIPRTIHRNDLNTADFKSAADSVELMYDARPGHTGVADAVKLIEGATHVCFLGFSFDPDNITRLGLNKVCAGKTKVYATRYMTARGDWARTVQKMHPVILNEADEHFEKDSINWDCLRLLHETGALG
jgi:hypothetical protein